MKPDLLLLIVTILVALTFDFLNGFHDAANSIATVVSTRVLSPKLAVAWAAFFNFVAAFLLGTAVAKTIGSGMIRVDQITQYVVITALIGAIVWDLLTWWWGLPTSSSHALIGGRSWSRSSGCCEINLHRRLTCGSASCNCFRPPPTAWVTAATMRKKRWELWPALCMERIF